MVVRRADSKDCLSLQNLYIQMEDEQRSADSRIQNNRYRYQNVKEELMCMIQRPEYECWIVQKEDKLIGVIDGLIQKIPMFSHRVGILTHWYVTTEERNRGIGNQLLHTFCSAAREHGAAYVSCQLMEYQKAAEHLAKRNEMSPYLLRMCCQNLQKGNAQKIITSVEQSRGLANQIYPLEKKLIPEVIPLLRQLEETEKALDHNLTESQFQDTQAAVMVLEGRMKEIFGFLSKQESQVTGYIEGRATYVQSFAQKAIILNKIFIRQEYRGQGIGHYLYEAFYHKAVQLSGDFIWLQVLCKNELALQFYHSIGFEAEAVRYLGKLQ